MSEDNIMRFVVGGMMILFFVAGAGLFLKGLQSLFQTLRRRPRLISVEGLVLNIEKKAPEVGRGDLKRRNRHVAHYPIIQFHNGKGEPVTFRSEVGDYGKSSRYHSGQTLKVLYDPEGEVPPIIDSWSDLWFPSVGATAGGLVFVAGSLMIWTVYGDRILG